MARPKTPQKIVDILGNPGKRKRRNEPSPPEAIPPMPRFLGKIARKEWRRIVPELSDCGLLTSLDMAALSAYCSCYEHWVEAAKKVQELGPVITTPNGLTQTSPYVTQRNQALQLMKKFMVDLGLSPAARTRVTVIEKTGRMILLRNTQVPKNEAVVAWMVRGHQI